MGGIDSKIKTGCLFLVRAGDEPQSGDWSRRMQAPAASRPLELHILS